MKEREPTMTEILAANVVDDYLIGLITLAIQTMRLINQGAASFDQETTVAYIEEYNRRVNMFIVDPDLESKEMYHCRLTKEGKIVSRHNNQSI